jgi:tripartite-type tricarboxylate transporter receptor subunit TctC
MARGNRRPPRQSGRRTFTTAALAVAGTLASGATHAQGSAYPVKPVRVVVPYTAGGNVDLTARVLARKFSEMFKQQVIVDNRPGASTIIGTEYVARAAPDGHTLLLTGSITGPHTINPGLFAKLPYDTVRDFAPISLVTRFSLVLVVHPSLRATTVKELIALARAKPGALNAATGGAGGSAHLALELLMSLSGVRFTQIHYKGNAPGLADTVAGQTFLMIDTPSTALPQVRGGRLRALAVTSLERSPQLPDTPTLAESGFPGYEVNVSLGLHAPAGTPRDIIDRLASEVARVARDGETRQLFAGQGSELLSSTPDEFGAAVKADIAKWEKVIRQAGIKIE